MDVSETECMNVNCNKPSKSRNERLFFFSELDNEFPDSLKALNTDMNSTKTSAGTPLISMPDYEECSYENGPFDILQQRNESLTKKHAAIWQIFPHAC